MILLCVKVFVVYLLFCWTYSVSSPQVINLSQAIFVLLRLIREASTQFRSSIKRHYTEYRQHQALIAHIARTMHCENCALLQNEVNKLEAELLEVRVEGEAFNDSLREVWNEHRIELQTDLNEATAQLQQTMHYLRTAESQVKQQRGEIRSLTEELRIARDCDKPEFRSSLATHHELEQLRHLNEQLRIKNLQQWSNTIAQKQRAVKAEKESEYRADWIMKMTSRQRDLRQELDEAQKELQHQIRRADEQREARIRNEELWFAAPRRKQETMYT